MKKIILIIVIILVIAGLVVAGYILVKKKPEEKIPSPQTLTPVTSPSPATTSFPTSTPTFIPSPTSTTTPTITPTPTGTPIYTPTPTTTPKTTPTPPSPIIKEYTISGNEFSLSPSSITVNTGETVRITFKNNGKIAHNLTFEGLGVSTSTIGAGQSDMVEFIAKDAGTYTYYCSVDNHKGAGMKGTLVIK